MTVFATAPETFLKEDKYGLTEVHIPLSMTIVGFH
jgi:hypothetical protein